MFRLSSLLATCLLVPSIFAIPASQPSTTNLGTVVQLRIEGDKKTIFEGPIFTRGHDVQTTLGGIHHCDGTNLGAHPTPGPTATSALDDASKLRRFVWDGKFFPDFDDYLVSNIDGVRQPEDNSKFWNLFLNHEFAQVGGCQLRVKFLDEVLWSFGAFDEPALKLSGSTQATRVGQPVTLTITDGRNGNPISGASVNGQTSDANGHVSVTFDRAGVQSLKAEKANTVRSNSLKIVVKA